MRRRLEYGLMIAGSICLLLFCIPYLKFQLFQTRGASLQGSLPLTPRILHTTDMHPVIGHINIRRLAFSVAMVEGDDASSLELAAGHMPGTALPGRPGNMVIAGHRDSAFWPLRQIQVGDRIEVAGATKAVYRVRQSQVIEPEDVSVLEDTKEPTLTLITCYPFRYVGPAPQRFVVKAHLVSAE